MSEKISINFKKTCSCPDSHINCLTPKDWVRGQVAIWDLYYEKRDIRDKDIHHLGTMMLKEYIKGLREIYKGILPLLKPKAHCVINVNDLWENNH